ncbi:MAG: RibD family protein [Anaerolineae bacterium]|nr:RibD family protein [Anaerolineae bacterium]
MALELLPTDTLAHRQRAGRPFVTLSYAQSLDGCIAARPDQPLALSGPASLKLTHQLRAAHDAILVGIGTILADNPRLNVRLVSGQDPQPVIVDSRLRCPPDAKLLRQSRLPWLATGPQPDPTRQQALAAAGARILSLPTQANGYVNLAALLDCLGDLNINSLMVEGGARIITSFLSEQLADYLVLTVTPTLLGGLRAVNKLETTSRLRAMRYKPLGEDMIISGYLNWE